jgi:MFS family permease
MITYYQTSPFWITFGLSAYSLFAFLSAPVLGQLSDRYGRKPLLLLCVIGTAMSFVVLVLTQNIWLYLISRIINGITGGNISIIQSIMSDISKTSEERMKKFGLMGMLFGLAFII